MAIAKTIDPSKPVYPDYITMPITVDNVIGGKLVDVSYVLSPGEIATVYSDLELKNHIKEKLAFELALQMIERKLIDYTMQTDINKGIDTVHARCYLSDSADVRVVRQLK